MELRIDGQRLGLAELRQVWRQPVTVALGENALERVAASNALIADVVKSGKSVYGVNTGFGKLADVRISDDELVHLQENLIRSHSVGVGELLPDPCVRLVLVTKIAALAQGCSGVRPALIEALCELVNRDICPCIPSKGSVGASGDLAPLAHMAGVLLGEGSARVNGERVDAIEALTRAGLQPLQLAPKEGLALLNGTQVSTALTLSALFRAEHVLSASVVAGAMSADAIQGSDVPFDKRIQEVRGHAGQAAVAGLLRDLMQGSEIRASHIECNRVQDPYSIRCQPQVAGACLDVMRHVGSLVETEANAVTDNPLVFTDTKSVLSGGNFHAEPVALAADYLALAIAEIGSLAERRVALLIDPHLNGGLPAFLVREGGLNSGFMMAQVTAAALASENKSLAHPASVDTIPTSANQEDHVSMATYAALRLHGMLDNVQNIVAIELLAAAQGIELHRPKRSSDVLERVVEKIRGMSEPYTDDRPLSDEIRALAARLDAGLFYEHAETVLPSASQ